jgi:hypothetical protein
MTTNTNKNKTGSVTSTPWAEFNVNVLNNAAHLIIKLN